jgi:beta-phosphoglucomutase-like phosphatase (HAD superfamily)
LIIINAQVTALGWIDFEEFIEGRPRVADNQNLCFGQSIPVLRRIPSEDQSMRAAYGFGLTGNPEAPLPGDSEISRKHGAREARTAGMQTAVLPNSLGRESHDPYAAYDLDMSFDVAMFSEERGIRKTNTAIFALTLDRLGVSAESCVFADDTEENLVPAHLMGMTASIPLTGRRPLLGFAGCSDCAGANVRRESLVQEAVR